MCGVGNQKQIMHKIETKCLGTLQNRQKFQAPSAHLLQKYRCCLRAQVADIDFRTSGADQFPNGVTTGPDHMFHLRLALMKVE